MESGRVLWTRKEVCRAQRRAVGPGVSVVHRMVEAYEGCMDAVPCPKWISVEGLGKSESAATVCGLC